MEACFAKCHNSNALFGVLRSSGFQSPSRASISSTALSSGIRSTIKCKYEALLVDAGGTLLQLTKPVARTYAEIGRKYGVTVTEIDIKQRFKKSFANSTSQNLRYKGDGRSFWRRVVAEATGCADNDYFEEVYEYYANADAWCLPERAHEVLCHLRYAGVRMAVVSNFDTRLRKLLKDLRVIDLFDAVIISSEVEYEKPDPRIFITALDQLSLKPEKVVHVGDDENADKEGAAAAGITCWLWGSDVQSFSDIQYRILSKS